MVSLGRETNEVVCIVNCCISLPGLSPMHLATLAQSTDCIRYLKALGADVNVEVWKHQTGW